MLKTNIIILSFLIKLMAATGTLSDVPTIESLGLRVSLVAQPADEQAIRARAANTLLEIYHHLNRAGDFPKKSDASGIAGMCDYQRYISGGKWVEVFDPNFRPILVPKKGCSTFSALKDIREAPVGTISIECYGAAIIAEFALNDCFYTDLLKGKCEQMNFMERVDTAHLAHFDEPTQRTHYSFSDTPQTETGDYVYFNGHVAYKEKWGNYYGENTFMVGHGTDGLRKYIGFGENFKTGPKTDMEILQNLAEGHVSFESKKSSIELDDKTRQEAINNALDEIRQRDLSIRHFSLEKAKENERAR
jgi:hypothetical protein